LKEGGRKKQEVRSRRKGNQSIRKTETKRCFVNQGTGKIYGDLVICKKEQRISRKGVAD
jgi:hypothetical protein